MYYGSTLSFLATAIWSVSSTRRPPRILTADFGRWLRYERPAGLLLSVIVFVVYKIALTFEE